MATVAAAGSQLGQDAFLQLLVAQVQNQNPLDPIDDTEFVAQLAQFNSLSSLQQLNASFSQMLQLQQLTQGADLIGKNVQYTGENGETVTGSVDRVISDGNQILLDVDGVRIGLDAITAVIP